MGKRSDCAINHALEIFGDKWTLLVIRDMVFKGATSFSELSAMSENIATNILADRLTRLEQFGIIDRQRDHEDGRRARYELTQSGRGLIPLLLDIMAWSHRHDPSVNVSAETAARIENERQAVLLEIERRLDAVV